MRWVGRKAVLTVFWSVALLAGRKDGKKAEQRVSCSVDRMVVLWAASRVGSMAAPKAYLQVGALAALMAHQTAVPRVAMSAASMVVMMVVAKAVQMVNQLVG